MPSSQGLDFFRRNAQADLLHLLFSARARVVTGDMPKADGASYLSGLVLGADVDTAVSLLGLVPVRHGAPDLYARRWRRFMTRRWRSMV
jgi:hypothetical protein